MKQIQANYTVKAVGNFRAVFKDKNTIGIPPLKFEWQFVYTEISYEAWLWFSEHVGLGNEAMPVRLFLCK